MEKPQQPLHKFPLAFIDYWWSRGKCIFRVWIMRITHHWIIFWVFEVFIAIHFCSSTWIYVAPYDLRAYGSASPPSPRSVWRWHPHGLAWLGESTSQPQADLVASRAAPRCWLGDLPASWMSLTLDFLWAYWFVVYNLFTGNAKTQTLKKEKKNTIFSS